MRSDAAQRPDPDRLLHEITEEEEAKGARQRGRLKIFFGYAAGVGKTYAMLDAARENQEAGTDVVAGYVEPHDRPDTAALLHGLRVLTPRLIRHRGITLREFDLDAALACHPQVILVDELAHTNAEGCRHRKRYQDIIELLDAGIDVYTTVNVQHLESLHDIVASITHIQVNERVPDSLFDNADRVELIDIEPEELLKRMDAGKVYGQEQATRARSHFFTKENLTALREIALRRTADRVNRSVAKERLGGKKDYYTGEHVLICLSPSPTNAKVIRTAARMAYAFQAQLTAVVVETEDLKQSGDKVKKGLEANLALAKQFRASVVTLYGDDIAVQIAGYARDNGVSKIVIGRAVRRRGIQLKPNLIDRLIRLVPGMDIYVIPDAQAALQKPRRGLAGRKADAPQRAELARQAAKTEERKARTTDPHLLLDLAKTAFILSVATVLGMGIEACGLGVMNVVMLYLMAVVLTAYFTHYRAFGVFSSIGSVLLYNFFFTEPRFTLRADASIYPFTFIAMLFCAVIISSLAGRLKRQALISKEESRRMQILIGISNKMKLAEDTQEVLDICMKQIMGLLGRNVICYNTIDGSLERSLVCLTPDAKEDEGQVLLGEDEKAVAAWVRRYSHKAGRSTDTLPGAAGYYLPVRQDGQVYAVIGIQLREGDVISPNDQNILHVILNETSIVIRTRLKRETRPC